MIIEAIVMAALTYGGYKTGKQRGDGVGEKVANLTDSRTRR